MREDTLGPPPDGARGGTRTQVEWVELGSGLFAIHLLAFEAVEIVPYPGRSFQNMFYHHARVLGDGILDATPLYPQSWVEHRRGGEGRGGSFIYKTNHGRAGHGIVPANVLRDRISNGVLFLPCARDTIVIQPEHSVLCFLWRDGHSSPNSFLSKTSAGGLMVAPELACRAPHMASTSQQAFEAVADRSRRA